MTFSPDDIEIKEFVPTLRGYDRAEVRAYLRAVAEDVRRLEERLNERATDRAAAGLDTSHVGSSLSAHLEAGLDALGTTAADGSAAGPSRAGVPLDVPLRVHEPTAMRDLEHAVRDLTFAIQAIAARTGVLDRAAATVRSRRVDPVATGRNDVPVPDRRSANRPWANVERPAAVAEPVDWSLPASARRGTRLDRSAENRSMIERFLPRALGEVVDDDFLDEDLIEGASLENADDHEAATPADARATGTGDEGPGGSVLPFVRAV